MHVARSDGVAHTQVSIVSMDEDSQVLRIRSEKVFGGWYETSFKFKPFKSHHFVVFFLEFCPQLCKLLIVFSQSFGDLDHSFSQNLEDNTDWNVLIDMLILTSA